LPYLLTQKGTPFIYYGDEIGMTNACEFQLEDYRDVAVFNKHKDLVKWGLVSEENYLKGLQYTSRDNSRTPMQWNDTENAGFTTGEPWIKVNSNYGRINATKQIEDPKSIFNFYRSLIDLRKNNQVLVYGSFLEINKKHSEIYSYIRELEDQRMLIMVNFFGKEALFELPKNTMYEAAELLLGNYEVKGNDIKTIRLKPYEARIYKLLKL